MWKLRLREAKWLLHGYPDRTHQCWKCTLFSWHRQSAILSLQPLCIEGLLPKHTCQQRLLSSIASYLWFSQWAQFPEGIPAPSLLLLDSCRWALINMSSRQCVVNPSALPSYVMALLEPCEHSPGRCGWAVMGKQMSLLSMSWNRLPELMFQWVCLLPVAG
jgi:hypothetical protein